MVIDYLKDYTFREYFVVEGSEKILEMVCILEIYILLKFIQFINNGILHFTSIEQFTIIFY